MSMYYQNVISLRLTTAFASILLDRDALVETGWMAGWLDDNDIIFILLSQTTPKQCPAHELNEP